MNENLKKEILASSSGWVSALLNFFPGLGVGYIYQRRWRAYWITTLTSIIWLIYTFYNDLTIDHLDPLETSNDSISFLGLFLIAVITSFEAWIAVKHAKKISE